jgi:hypothetical protein
MARRAVFTRKMRDLALGIGLLVLAAPIIALISTAADAIAPYLTITVNTNTYDFGPLASVAVAFAGIGVLVYAVHKLGIRVV